MTNSIRHARKWLSKNYHRIRDRIAEIYHRIIHAIRLFRTRLLLLAVTSHVDLPEDFVFDIEKAVPRGRQAPDRKYYSSTYELDWKEIPDPIKAEIKKFDSVLRLYFGGDYLINRGVVWRNLGIPDEYQDLDIYSQVWHYDHVVDYRNVQLFVLMTRTTELHGPFEWIENSSERRVLHDVAARNGKELFELKAKKLTGVRGDALLFATGATPHRAGIPVPGNYRDMFSIAFFPEYTGIGISSCSLLGR
jgi:hypothetical protein